MITDQYIRDLELQAQYCDDYSQYKREMDHIARLKAKCNEGRASVQARKSDAEKRAQGVHSRSQLRTKADVERDRQSMISNAIDKMEQHLGYA